MCELNCKSKTADAANKQLQSERVGSPFCSFTLDQRADSPAIHRTEVGVYELRVFRGVVCSIRSCVRVPRTGLETLKLGRAVLDLVGVVFHASNTPRASELTNFLAACATFNIRIFFSSLRAMSWSRMLPKGASSFATHIIQPYPSSPHLGLPLAGHVSTALLHTTHAMMHHALRWLTALRRWCSLNKIVGTCSGWFSVTSR